MSDHHIPNLKRLAELPDDETRFYALIGAIVSLSTALELSFLSIFQKATGLSKPMAAAILYENINSSYRRDIADKTMRHYIDGKPELAAWDSLYRRIVNATGGSGLRNLLAHGLVYQRVTPASGGIGAGPIGAAPIGAFIPGTQEFLIAQHPGEILAGKRKPQSENLKSLLAFAEELASLNDAIAEFLKHLP